MDTISSIVGKTITSIDGQKGSDTLRFNFSDGSTGQLLHHQDCCETVELADICGDLLDLVGAPIIFAEEVSNAPDSDNHEYSDSSHTWTFYHLGTKHGTVTLRWLGESNGYYSEEMEFRWIRNG